MKPSPYSAMRGLLAALALLLAAGPGQTEETAMKLRSPAFADGGAIPRRYTCEGADISPPLAWAGVPEGARSLALIVEDPDAPDPRAPRMVWTHWVVHDLPAEDGGLAEGASGRAMPQGAVEGYNDWKRTGWGGPCPPIGRHRYIFTLHALDTALPRQPMTRDALRAAMKGHVLSKATLTGLYEKGR